MALDIPEDSEAGGKKSGLKRLRTFVLVCWLLTLVGLAWRTWIDATTRQVKSTFVASDGEAIDYLLHLPSEYRQSDRRWPLILFLHGAGECGNGLDRLKGIGLLKYVEQHDDFPFIVVSPQARRRGWAPTLLGQLLDDVVSRYRIDQNRVYVTGFAKTYSDLKSTTPDGGDLA